MNSYDDSKGTNVDAVVKYLESKEAIPGDVVLLWPACSSFDMFRNYAERGKVFCMAVEQLTGESAIRGRRTGISQRARCL